MSHYQNVAACRSTSKQKGAIRFFLSSYHSNDNVKSTSKMFSEIRAGEQVPMVSDLQKRTSAPHRNGNESCRQTNRASALLLKTMKWRMWVPVMMQLQQSKDASMQSLIYFSFFQIISKRLS